MKRRRCVREGIFERNNGLWWLNKENQGRENTSTPTMTIALKHGGISRVIDVKHEGLSSPLTGSK